MIIAELKLPKQVITPLFSIIIWQNDKGTFSTHYKKENGTLFEGRYGMDFEHALEDFKDRCGRELNRGPQAFELGWEVENETQS